MSCAVCGTTYTRQPTRDVDTRNTTRKHSRTPPLRWMWHGMWIPRASGEAFTALPFSLSRSAHSEVQPAAEARIKSETTRPFYFLAFTQNCLELTTPGETETLAVFTLYSSVECW